MEVELALRDKISKSIDKAKGKIRQFGDRVRKVAKSVFTLRNAMGMLAVTAIGKSFVTAASKIEVFGNQLLMVTKNAKAADNALKAIREFARTSPLETEDVVQSFVRLRAIGLEPTMEQMKTLGGVAVLMGRQMTDVLQAFIGLNKRTLRELGIDIDRTGQKAVIQSGNIRKVVEKDSASIRAALIEIWEERFPNAIEVAANTTKSKIAIMKSNIFELSAVIGKNLLPALNKVVGAISKAAEETRRWYTEAAAEEKMISGPLTAASAAAQGLGIKLGQVRKRIESIKETSAGYVDSTTNLIISNEEVLALLEKEEQLEKAIQKIRQTAAGDKKKVTGTGDPLGGTGKLGSPAVDGAGKSAADAAAKAAVKAEEKKFKELKKKYDEFVKQFEVDEDIRLKNIETRADQVKAAEKAVGDARIMGIEDERIRELAILDAKWSDIFLTVQNNEEALRLMTEAKRLERLELIKNINKRELDDEKRNADKKKDIERQANEYMVTSAKRAGSALFTISAQAIANSKESAKKRRNIMLGVAIIEGAASVVTAIKSGIDEGDSMSQKIAYGILAGATAAALVAGDISTISNQQFGRGTSFAPGGTALVGEYGPELVNLPRGAQVKTAAQTRQTISNTVSPTIVINGNVDQGTLNTLDVKLREFANTQMEAQRRGYLV